MDKQTKTLAMVGILAVGGYLIYKQYNKPKSFSGGVGRRVGLTGVAENLDVRSSNWVRPSINRQKLELTGIENTSFTNSGWVRPSLNGQKLGLTGIENLEVRPSRFAWRWVKNSF